MICLVRIIAAILLRQKASNLGKRNTTSNNGKQDTVKKDSKTVEIEQRKRKTAR